MCIAGMSDYQTFTEAQARKLANAIYRYLALPTEIKS
jgi:hypothetical protein